jgi:RHS repeat-associated protein
MVLTQQRDTSNYLASMEAAYRATESLLFANIAATSYPRASVAGYPADVSVTNPNDSVAKVDYNGSSGQKTGPSLLLKVMSGDTVKMGVQSYYNSGSGSTTNSSFTDVLNSLAGGIANVTSGAHGGFANLSASTSPIYTGLTSFLTNNETTTSGYPKAYLNWIFLDDQFNYVSSLSGAVPAASSTYPAGQLNTVAPGSQLVLSRSGYLYVWVSNETQGWDVFFDNLSVQHRQGPVLEENHYYPFGLTMAGISDKAIKTRYVENKYRYNGGNELQNKEFGDGTGLELYDAEFRTYDPQIGRLWQIDPLADINEHSSPYVFASNNPILLNDPMGLLSDSAHPQVLAEVTVTAKKKDCKTCSKISPAVHAGPPPGNGSAHVEKQSTLSKVAETAVAFVPIAGGVVDIYQGIRDGNWWQVALGAGSIVLDVVTLGGSSIEKGLVKTIVKEAVEETTKEVVVKATKEVVEEGVKEVVKESSKEGVYHILTKSGETYIGQSKNMVKRVISHFRKSGKLGKLGHQLEDVIFHSMPGSTKTEREIYEHYVLEAVGGPEAADVINKVRPMGGRLEEYAQKIESIIQKYNLPRYE